LLTVNTKELHVIANFTALNAMLQGIQAISCVCNAANFYTQVIMLLVGSSSNFFSALCNMQAILSGTFGKLVNFNSENFITVFKIGSSRKIVGSIGFFERDPPRIVNLGWFLVSVFSRKI